jgi:hypothetical protein
MAEAVLGRVHHARVGARGLAREHGVGGVASAGT